MSDWANQTALLSAATDGPGMSLGDFGIGILLSIALAGVILIACRLILGKGWEDRRV